MFSLFDEPSPPDYSLISPVIPDESEALFLPARIKLPAVLGAERLIIPLFAVGFGVFVFGLRLGTGPKSFHLVGHETSLIIGLGLGGGLVLLAGMVWALVDDYYVIDKPSRRIFVHRGFRLYGSDTAFLEAGDVLAIGLDCSEVRYKSNQRGWRYTPVLVTKDRRRIELSSWSTDMQCVRLPEFNQRVCEWAAALRCYWIKCPAGRDFRVKDVLDGTYNPLEPEPS